MVVRVFDIKEPRQAANPNNTAVTICCSGGLDSTCLIHYYSSSSFKIQGIHFDYGQPACKAEHRAVRRIAKHYGIAIHTRYLRPVINSSPRGEFYGRNLSLILSALSQFKQVQGLISIGIHASSLYYDCSPAFVQQVQAILDGYFRGAIVLDAPFLHFAKDDIVDYARTHQVPIEMTYSCEQHSDYPCGKCPSCKERARDDPRYAVVQAEANQDS